VSSVPGRGATQPLAFSRKKPGKEGKPTTKAVLKPNFYNYTISPNINKEESRENLQVSVKKLAELNRIPIGNFAPEEEKPRRVPTATLLSKMLAFSRKNSLPRCAGEGIFS
jgi:hypothetical protein